MNDTRPFTFLAQTPPRRDSEELLYANGIFADSGLPLCQLNISTAAQLAQGRPDSRHEQLVAQHKYDQATQPHYGTIGDVDPAKLEESGWGIVFSVNTEAKIKEALQPLLKLREQQAGRLFRVFENADSYRPGESCSEWLARHKVSLMPVDPEKGVPYYLLLVGAPEEIPFEFQYLLDVYWAVGRLHFDDSADYRRYAESVVAYEQATALPHTRRAAIFATSHEFDQATELFAKQVAVPLTKGDGARKPLGEKQNFRLQSFIGDSATKETLTQLLQGKIANGPPALLFTGSHGMGFHLNDPRLPEAQGALVCQDWAGWGKISENDWFAARDVPADAQVHGLIHFFFACYGAGCPQIDDFFSRPGQQPEQISPRALIAKLPQKLLAHPNGGALAALGHVDRAWSYSFYSEKAGAQLQGFQDVMGRLLRGDRLGQATDQFDVRRAALASQLTDVLQERGYGNKKISDQDIVNLWIARNDARNYIILGDPAVRLRVESLTDQWTARRVTSIAQPAIEPAAATSTMAPSLATENSLPQNNIETQLRRTKIMNETPSSAGGLPYDLFRAPGSADKELVDAWKAHVKNAYQRNELMFAQVLKGFMKPYWTTVWINGILVAVGVASFIVAAYMGYAKELEFSIIFGGLSTLTFLGYFISRPLRALEQNLMFITWLGLIYNTYWMRLANCLNEPTAREDLANLQKDASQDIERLIAKHTEVAAKLPDLKEKEKGEEKDKKDKKDEEKKADEKAAASTSTTDGRQQQQQQQNQLVDEKLTADEEIAC